MINAYAAIGTDGKNYFFTMVPELFDPVVTIIFKADHTKMIVKYYYNQCNFRCILGFQNFCNKFELL